VIFVRKGHYRGGVFKFVLLIPPHYPDEGPKVHFLSEVSSVPPRTLSSIGRSVPVAGSALDVC
jgi:ubiquitin-protein ligase